MSSIQRTCKVNICSNIYYAKSYCRYHYRRSYKKLDMNNIKLTGISLEVRGSHYVFMTEYGAWANMKSRCHNINHKAYNHYGARGITVCNRWRYQDGFENFILDLDWKKNLSLTLERKDNELGYTPDNCYWANRSEQQCNRRKLNRNTSGYIGISWQKGKWIVAFRIMYKDYYLGRFDDVEEAALEYDKGIIFFRGKDGVTNFL